MPLLEGTVSWKTDNLENYLNIIMWKLFHLSPCPVLWKRWMRTVAMKRGKYEYENNEYQLAGGFALASATSRIDTLRWPLPPESVLKEWFWNIWDEEFEKIKRTDEPNRMLYLTTAQAHEAGINQSAAYKGQAYPLQICIVSSFDSFLSLGPGYFRLIHHSGA